MKKILLIIFVIQGAVMFPQEKIDSGIILDNVKKLLLNNDVNEFARHCEKNEFTDKTIEVLRSRKYEYVEFPFSKIVKEENGQYYIKTRLKFKYIGYFNNQMNNVEGDIGADLIIRMENADYKIVRLNIGGDIGTIINVFKVIMYAVFGFLALVAIVVAFGIIRQKK